MAAKGEGPATGTDSGNTYSCAGVWQHDPVEIIANDPGNRTTPYIAFTDSERLIGDAAKNQVAMNPINTVFGMAGKANTGKNKKGSNLTDTSVMPDASLTDSSNTADSAKVDLGGVAHAVEPHDDKAETSATEQPTSATSHPKQGELHLYPVSVKTLGGEKLELQLNPGDSVMDVRQFLLDAPETCYFTCYELLLHTKDGSTHHLEDYNEIAEVADITIGDCHLEMIAATYDDRSIRAHVHRARELLSLSTVHASLSTSLALQHETMQNLSENSLGAGSKAEPSELDGLGFMEDVSDALNKLLSPSCEEIKSVESIVFSSLNPPPSHRRLVGDLIYLDVTTLEGGKFCITGTTRMFYVNSSSGTVLDPRPTKAAYEATTFIGLLQKISSRFRKAFKQILKRKSSAHPFENVQSIMPPNMWLGMHPVPDHKRDAARAENAVTLTYGGELIGMQRDWNEELQSCREFPHTNPQERILRDRALYKVTSDFVDAAINGAIGVISRCIPPINPADPECFHMYVHNNIFFSFAIDADLEQLSKNEINGVYLKLNVNNDCADITASESGKNIIKIEANGSNHLNVHEAAESVSDTSAETQLADSEQATYASANNDLKGTRAFQEADVPGLYNLAMAIIDYRGHRVVAQSVLPGILQGDKSDSLLYGSVDNGKKICWNEDFHSKVVEAAQRLHLKEHSVLDGSGNVFKLAAPVECKGIVGSDDRHYLLDLMRVTPRDANFIGPAARFCILRPELITAFCQAEATARSKSKSEDIIALDSTEVPKADGQTITDSNGSEAIEPQEALEEGSKDAGDHDISTTAKDESAKQICFNPNAFTEFKMAASSEEVAADEEDVRKAGSYLVNVVLPKFIQDLCSLEVSPMDGQTLTEALHAHGINIRYIGKVAEGIKHLPHLWDLCTNEIAVRSAKHILKGVLRDTEDHCVGPAVAHFFNCFFGNCQAAAMKGGLSSMASRYLKKEQGSRYSRGKGRWKHEVSSKNSLPPWMNMCSESLWNEISEFAKLKYKFELPEDARSQVKKVSVIRNLSQKVGITVAARRYDLNVGAPFQVPDVLDLQPVVKHSIPICSEAKDLVEAGKIQLAEGMLGEAYTSFLEAFSILQQVTGPMHREVANCCRYLAMVLYHAGDMAGAIMQQHKELIINERCLGLDHPDTAHSYGNMALFYHGLNQTQLALRHMSRALLLLSLSSGPDHPDVATTFINVAMMYQDIGKMDTALRYLQEALKKNERLLGQEHIQTAVCYHALAIAFNCMGAFKLSHQHEKKAYDILVKQLGEEDSRTQDSQNWMKTFKLREMHAQKANGKPVDATSAKKAVDMIKAHPDLIQALQAAAAASENRGSTGNSAAGNKSMNAAAAAALMGEALPRVGGGSGGGRGVDERGARAAAEVRKKAAARGLLIRPHGVPVQALPPLNQLLNMINASSTASGVEASADAAPPDSNREVKEADKSQSKAPVDEPHKHEVAAQGKTEQQQEQGVPPVGLGTGLSTLEPKNKKHNKKARQPKSDIDEPHKHEVAAQGKTEQQQEQGVPPVGLGTGLSTLETKNKKHNKKARQPKSEVRQPKSDIV